MHPKFTEVREKIFAATTRYPMVLAMAFIAAISAAAAISIDGQPSQFQLVRLAITACLGISVMFAVKILSQRIGKEFLLQILGLGILWVFFFVLPSRQEDFTSRYASILLPSFILSHLLVSFAPFFGKSRELSFWQYNKNLFVNIFLTAIFTGVLVGGILLAILAVDKLFDFNFNEKIYPEIFFFTSIFGSASIFLIFNGKGLKQLEIQNDYPLILKFFTQFILIPLLLIYVVILYFYFGKILLAWQLPRGWVSYLILAYSVVGILALLLVWPLKNDSAKSWVKAFSRIFYYSLFPLLGMLFVAIFTRILEYGYTEPRYFVLILALWLSTVVFYFILIKKNTIKFIPVSLFLFGIFALIFPYLNAFSVAKRSQKNELLKDLKQNQLLENGKILFNKKIADTVAYKIADRFVFLAQRNEKEFLLKLIPTEKSKLLGRDLKEMDRYNLYNDVRDSFDVIETARPSEKSAGFEMISAQSIFPVKDYDFAILIGLGIPERSWVNDDFLTVETGFQRFDITIKNVSGKEEKINVMKYFDKLALKNKHRNGRFSVPEIAVNFETEKYIFKIFADELDSRNGATENSLPLDKAVILIKKK